MFFDEKAVEWRYETEGFILAPSGEWYLPDFYLPELGAWIEVKGKEPDEKALRKAYLLNYGFAHDEEPAKRQERVFILHGDIPWPYPQQGNIVGFSASHAPGNKYRWDLTWQLCPLCQQLLIGRIGHMCCRGCEEEFGMMVDDALDVVVGLPEFDKVVDIVPAMVSGAMGTPFFRSGHKASKLQEAYEKARSARFEFDERNSAVRLEAGRSSRRGRSGLLSRLRPSVTQLPRRHEPVEKVAAIPIGNLESGTKRPKTRLSAPKTGVTKGHEGVFQQAHTLSEGE